MINTSQISRMANTFRFNTSHAQVSLFWPVYPFESVQRSCVILQGVTKIKRDSVFAPVSSGFTTQITACPNALELYALSDRMLHVLDRSLSQIPVLVQDWYRCRMYQHEISVHEKETFNSTVEVYNVQYLVDFQGFDCFKPPKHSCGSPFTIIERNIFILIGSFVAVKSVGALKDLMWHFQCPLTKAFL